MNIVTKRVFGEVKSADDGIAPNGAFSLVLSTPAKDRDGEQVKTEEWQQPLPEHITFDADHGMSVASTVGSGRPYIDDQGRMMVDGTYASTPMAQQVRSLVNEGHIRTASVAFLRRTLTDEQGAKVVTRELLNGAFVAVPANPEAVILDSKAATKEGRRNSTSDAEMIQTIHDHASSLGAACSADGKAVRRGPLKVHGEKSIIGSVEALRDRVCDCLEDTFGAWRYSLRGVIPGDGGGTVVYDLMGDDGGVDTFRAAYSDDGSVVTLTGDPEEVDILEVVVPDPDADREPVTAGVDAAATAHKAAVTAESPAAISKEALRADVEAFIASH